MHSPTLPLVPTNVHAATATPIMYRLWPVDEDGALLLACDPPEINFDADVPELALPLGAKVSVDLKLASGLRLVAELPDDASTAQVVIVEGPTTLRIRGHVAHEFDLTLVEPESGFTPRRATTVRFKIGGRGDAALLDA